VITELEICRKLFQKINGAGHISHSRKPSNKLFITGILPAVLGTAFFFWGSWNAGRNFSRITEDLFRSEMLENTLNMHYTVANPADFGLKNYEAVLPGYSREGREEAIVQTEEALEALNNLKKEHLSDRDAYTHQLLTRSLDTALLLNNYTYYEDPLSPSSGMQTQLPILLAEYTFRSKRDVEDYLDLLDQTDEYFASLLTFQQEKAQAGLLQPASSLAKVRKQCDTIVTSKVLETDTHFLQTTFAERLAELSKDDGMTAENSQTAPGNILTAEDIAAYTAENNRLLKTVLLPAYEALSDGLFLLEDDTIPLSGLASKPQGRDYYQHLLIAETGSYRPVEEVKALLTAKLQEEYDAMRALLTENPGLKEHFLTKQHLNLPFTNDGDGMESMLTDLQQRMSEDFPSLAEHSTGSQDTTTVTIKSVDPSLEAYCAPAFYLTAPIDDTDTNVIYINQKNSPKGLELYTTLAHEGYPGHLYQTVYNNRNFAAARENPVRQLLWYGGYLEGWALHVEFTAYDYAAELMNRQSLPISAETSRHNASSAPETDELSLNALSIQLEKHNRNLQLCLFSILDIMIHYESASYNETAGILKNFGVENPDSAKAIYTYITEEPCNYLKYYLGYLEILELQKSAQELWEEDYSDYNFHKFYLDCGPSDFTTLGECLTTYSEPAVRND